MLVKGIGVDLISAGRIVAQQADQILVQESTAPPSYARLTVHRGQIVGAVLLGVPEQAPKLLAAVRSGQSLAELGTPWTTIEATQAD